MLILEGPDGCGKTTLARELTKALANDGYVYSHFTRLPNGFHRYWGYVESIRPRIVQDRFHLSEIVYADARGDISPLSPELYRLVDAKIRLVGGFTVLITADPDLVFQRWHKEQMFDRDKTVSTAELYHRLEKNFPQYRMDIDYRIECGSEKPFPTIYDLNEILARYRQRQRTVWDTAKEAPFLKHTGL